MAEKKLKRKVKAQRSQEEQTSSFVLLQLSNSLTKVQEENRQVHEMAIRSILKALDCKDNYTYGHSLRVAHNCLILGRHLGLNAEELYELEVSALFHDIGKIGIPDHILSKPHGLTPEEFHQMKRHPDLSYEILKGFKSFEKVAINARHHHERYDGKGYPHGLKGDDIPFVSRIILIADTFDAITSSRSYRKGMDEEVALKEILEFAGTQFDPKLAQSFVVAISHYQKQKEDDSLLTTLPDEFLSNKKAA